MDCRPPHALTSYRSTILHIKLEYAHAIIRRAAAWLAEVQDMSPEAAFDGLAHVKRLRRSVKRIEETFEEAGIAEMYHRDQYRYRGQGYTAELCSGRDRKDWDTAGVMDELIEHTFTDLHHKHPSVHEADLRAIITATMWKPHRMGRIQWRSTSLRRIGIDPDDYSETTRESPTIRLTGPASYTTVKKRPRGVR